MHFKDKLDSINAYICIRVHTVSGINCNVAAILPETNLHAKSSIATTLQQYCQKLLLQYFRNIAAIYCQKACISIRDTIRDLYRKIESP